MNQNPGIQPSGPRAPAVKRTANPFLVWFHVLTVGTLVWCLGSILYWNWPRLGHRELTLIALLLIQAGLYVKRFILTPLELAPWWWIIYFAGGYLCCLLESLLAPDYIWLAPFYLSPMCGVLPARSAVPLTLAGVAGAELAAYGWTQLAQRSPGEWAFHASITLQWILLPVFVRRIITTSEQRAVLIVELEAAKRQLELARDRDVELATLRERERLARDLHDNLGHSLVTLTVQLEAAQRLLAADPARVSPMLLEMQKLTRRSTEDLRRSLANLRAPELGQGSLADALRALCAAANQRFGVAVECRLAENADAAPAAVAEVLWRVAQEGLTNVEKHAGARRARVELELTAKEFVLRVTDDGAGLPVGAEEKPGHYGLRGLRERVEGLGGAFTATAANHETTITARVPRLT